MNAPDPLPAAPTLVVAEVARIWPSLTNPRKHFPQDAHADLVASVRARGILQPLLLRPWPDHRKIPPGTTIADTLGGFEIVAGERRYRAASEAGLATVPALVRELTAPAAPAKGRAAGTKARPTAKGKNPAAAPPPNAPASPAKPAKPELAAGLIYCHPENPVLTWTGKGKEPRWVEDLFATGRGLDVRDKEGKPAAAPPPNAPASPAEPLAATALADRPAWPFPKGGQ